MRQEDIFIQYTPSSNHLEEEDSFFNLRDFLAPDESYLLEYSLSTPKFLPRVESLDQDPLFPALTHDDFYRVPSSAEETNEPVSRNTEIVSMTPSVKPKHPKTAKSHKTKNICFNICQKTIKILKTRIYNEKLKKLSAEYDVDSEEVISEMLKVKKTLTGPKALQMFVEQEKAVNQVFREFMKWFLEEKYLRHAINEGTMDDLKGYLQFKNEVVMNILSQ